MYEWKLVENFPIFFHFNVALIIDNVNVNCIVNK